MPNSQKQMITAAVILLVLIIGLGGLIFWQRQQIDKPDSADEQITEQQSDEKSTVTERTVNVSTEKQERIREVAPDTDLDQYDVPDDYLNENFLNNSPNSPAFKRSGNILSIDFQTSSFEFEDKTFSSAENAIYTVVVDKNTQINITETTSYIDTKTSEILKTKTENKSGALADLSKGDFANITAKEKINSNQYIAEKIYAKTNKIIESQ